MKKIVTTEDRIAVVRNNLLARRPNDTTAAYPYMAGYLEATLIRALDSMSKRKREEFLSRLELQVMNYNEI